MSSDCYQLEQQYLFEKTYRHNNFILFKLKQSLDLKLTSKCTSTDQFASNIILEQECSA